MITFKNPEGYSRKKRKVFSRKKVYLGGQIINANTIETYVYVNLVLTNSNGATGNTIQVVNISNRLVKNIITDTPGSVILSVDPSLSTLKDYTLFGYNGTSWKEIIPNNIDRGGNSVTLYGNVKGMLIRKQRRGDDTMASLEVSIPVPVSTYGNIMQFVNISSSNFPDFTLNPSTDTFSANVYIQLVFISTEIKNTGWSPSYIPGLSLWLNANEPGNSTFTPNSGVKMLNWTDKSGNNNHATAQNDTAPVYRSSPNGEGMGMYFNGSTFFKGNMRNTGKYSYTFIVARPDTNNIPTGRLLSLSASSVDDSSSNAYIGISGNSGMLQPNIKVAVMGITSTTNPCIKYCILSSTSTNSNLQWTNANDAWTNGACCSIAYGMGMFVAVGYSDSYGVIKYSYNGINWISAVMAEPYNINYGFFYYTSQSESLYGNGGIRTVIFTGSMWICGGCSSNAWRENSFRSVPGIAYSYDGINWIVNQTSLPFSGTGDCIRSIASDRNLIILTGYLTPSMAYSYDGINWFPMTIGVKTLSQVGNNNNTGIHAIAYDPKLKLWIAVGDGGNPNIGANQAVSYSESVKKIIWSKDGFKWNSTKPDEEISIVSFQRESNYTGVFLRRILPVFLNNNTHLLISGPALSRRGVEAVNGPIVSRLSNTSLYGFHLNGYFIGNFPVNGNSPAEVSALYTYNNRIYYGLQNPSSNSYLISSSISSDIEQPFWTNIFAKDTSITSAVNVIVDNTSGNLDCVGNIHLNKTTITSGVNDADRTKPFLISAWEDSLNTCVSINGSLVPTNKINPARFNISSYMIGKNNGTIYNKYIGYIYEIIVYNTLLYSQSKFAIEGYLAWKWGIQSLLPKTHMYYNNAPSKFALSLSLPKYFSDLQPILWLDAQDPNANESFAPDDRTFISTWYDKSGNKNDLTAPVGSEPMYTRNIISAGGLQFNRYPYKSMSYIPLSSTVDNNSDSDTSNYIRGTKGRFNNKPSLWISGFGSVGGGNFTWDSTYDAFSFIYISGTRDTPCKLFQYDEKNHQIRVLFSCSLTYDYATGSTYVNPTNGYIFFSIGAWVSENMPFVCLIPDSFPTTPNTSYPTLVVRDVIYTNPNTGTTTVLKGVSSRFVVDNNGNIYMYYSSTNNGNTPLYIIPSTEFTTEKLNNISIQEFNTNMCLNMIIGGGVAGRIYYIKENNSISLNTSPYMNSIGREVIYLNTLAIFEGSITNNILSVTNIISGTIQLYSSINVEQFPDDAGAATYIRIIIEQQQSGQPGGVGVYRLNRRENTVSNYTKFISVRICVEMSTGGASITSTSKNTLDGLMDLSRSPNDALTNTAGRLNSVQYRMNSFDSKTSNMFMTEGHENQYRLKRINLLTRQVTTMAGAINRVNTSTIFQRQEITSEKFPLEHGVFNNLNQIIYDTVGNSENAPSLYQSLIIGNEYAYIGIKNSSETLLQVARINNFRANPSCMSGPLSLTGSSVSVFIVYSNTNTNKEIMPHRSDWNTPVISLSSTADYCVIIGEIINTTLTISSIISGVVQIGATINTPLGGFISSYVSINTYKISIIQYVPLGTKITLSNGIGRFYTGNENADNGPTRGIDTISNNAISLYTNMYNSTVYRNNISNSVSTMQLSPQDVPGSGILTTFTGGISPKIGDNNIVTNIGLLTVTNVRSGVIQIGSIINIPSKPKVTKYGTTTNGLIGTYELDCVVNVPTGTVMTSSMPSVIPDIVFFDSSPSSVNTRLNGVVSTTSTTTSTTSSFPTFNVTSIGIGLQPSNISRVPSLLPNYFFDGTICEVIIYNTNLTTDLLRLELIEGYLAWKWGVQSKLPLTHRFKYSSPNEYIPYPATPIKSVTFSNILDYGFTVSWSGGDNAMSYTYTLTPLPTRRISIKDYGVEKKTAIIYGLNPNTPYSLVITANNLITTQSSASASVTTRIYTATLWAGSATQITGTTIGNNVDKILATFPGQIFGIFDNYNNFFLLESNLTVPESQRGIRVILNNGFIQTLNIISGNDLLQTGNTNRRGITIDDNGILYISINYRILKITPSEYPFTQNASGFITTTWSVTIFAGNGNVPTRDNGAGYYSIANGTFRNVGPLTTVPLNNTCSLLFKNIPSPYIADFNGFLRPITKDGTYIDILTNVQIGSSYFAFNDSFNIYILQGEYIIIYNFKSGKSYSVKLQWGYFTYYGTIDSVGNFFFIANKMLYRIMTYDIDLDDTVALSKILSTVENWILFFGSPSRTYVREIGTEVISRFNEITIVEINKGEIYLTTFQNGISHLVRLSLYNSDINITNPLYEPLTRTSFRIKWTVSTLVDRYEFIGLRPTTISVANKYADFTGLIEGEPYYDIKFFARKNDGSCSLICNFPMSPITPRATVKTLFDAQLNIGGGVEGDIAVDSAGNLYIADPNNYRIRKVATNGTITTFAGNGSSGSSGDGGAATNAQLFRPDGVAVDYSTGNVYIADASYHIIRRVGTDGIITTFAGKSSRGYSGDDGAATSAQLNTPRGIAVDSTGNVYIADTINNRIRKVAATTGIITTFAGNGSAGYSGDDGAATSAQLRSPRGVAVDSTGNVYIADTDNHRIRRVATNGKITTFAGNGSAGFSGGDGSNATSAQLNFPRGVAVDSRGDVYIADTNNHRIRRVRQHLSTTTFLIYNEVGLGSVGSSDGIYSLAHNSQLNSPTAVAVDSTGTVYIMDRGNGRIRIVV
jgi:sugar lactone lactonase YvrE